MAVIDGLTCCIDCGAYIVHAYDEYDCKKCGDVMCRFCWHEGKEECEICREVFNAERPGNTD